MMMGGGIPNIMVIAILAMFAMMITGAVVLAILAAVSVMQTKPPRKRKRHREDDWHTSFRDRDDEDELDLILSYDGELYPAPKPKRQGDRTHKIFR